MMTQKTRWGIIGAGQIARSFAQDVQRLPDAECLAIGSRSESKAQQFATELGVLRAYGRYEDLLSDPDVDIVYIATPQVFHSEQSLLCLTFGKPVLVEKPFALCAREAREVIALARTKQLFCMEAMWMRFIPAMRRAVQLIQGGAIGEIRAISTGLGFYNSFDPQSRIFDPQMGGGALFELGVYPLSLIVQLLGQPSSVSGHAIIGQSQVDEHVTGLLKFPDGQMATLSVNISAQNRNDALILGSHGSLQIQAPLYRPTRITLSLFEAAPTASLHNQSLKARLKNNRLAHTSYQWLHSWIAPFQGGSSEFVPCDGNGYGYEAAEAGRCLRTGQLESAIMPLSDTILALEIVDALREQWQTV